MAIVQHLHILTTNINKGEDMLRLMICLCLFALDNPWRFSSEYVDDDIGLVSYNFRQYDPTGGRWLSRDPMAERSGRNLYAMLDNAVPLRNDFLGLFGDGYEDICVESKGECAPK